MIDSLSGYQLVLKGEDLVASGVRTIADALQWVPGVFLTDVSGNGTQYWGSMRGMPAHNNRYYLVLVDGIPRNNATDEFWWFTVPIERVERIEIVKGPASALYGRTAMGGVINIISKKGGPQRGVSIAASYGSYGENRESGLASGQLNKFDYSLGMVHYGSDGWRDTNNSFDQYNVFGTFGYQFDKGTSLRLNVDYTDMDRDMPGGVFITDYLAGERKDVHFEESKTRHKEPNAALIFEKRFGDRITLTNRLYFQNVEEDWPNHWISQHKEDTGLRIGDELQAQYDHNLFGLSNRLIAGYQFEHQDQDIMRHYGIYYWNPAVVGRLYRDADAQRQFNAGYLQDTLSIIPDRLTLIAGLRYDHVHLDWENNLNPDRSTTKNMDAWSPKAGIIFSPMKELSLFANYATGFRTPVAQNIGDNPDMKPEKVRSYEMGVRGWLLERLRYQLSGYYSEFDDMLAYILAKPTNIVANAGEAESSGVEFELDAYITGGLWAFFTYNYNYTKLNKFVDWAGNDWSGKTPPFQPRNKIGGGIKYEHPCGFRGMLTVRWFDDQWISEANDIKLDAYTLVDIGLSYAFNKHFEVSLGVRNLFDEDYAAYGEDLGWGEIYLTPGDPRTIIGGLTVRF